MLKAILISTDVYLDLNSTEKRKFIATLQRMTDKGNVIYFVSMHQNVLDEIKEDIGFVKFVSRRRVTSFLKQNDDKKKYFIVFGNKDQDFLVAVHNKLLLLAPAWTQNIEPKVERYANFVESIEEFEQLIEVFNNQNSWYYKLELPDGSKVYSLMCAHYYSRYIPETERELILGFENLLKRGNKAYYGILYSHFMASISNNEDFRDVDIWSIFPSSSIEFNEDLMDFKEVIRTTMNSRNPPTIENGSRPNNLFIRHTAIDKSRTLYSDIRRRLGCSRHLDSVKLNDAYRGRLEGKTVCVFDDYLTHGNSFETARNLLKTQKVKRMIFISLGRFENPYLYQEYKFKGDVFNGNYEYELISCCDITGGVQEQEARKEVRNLHDIFGL